MQLLEINYSEKYDAFTGYLAKDSGYFRYDIDREKVELLPIGQEFADRNDFIRKMSEMNPHASFLSDPIALKEISYKELERYKRLARESLSDHSWRDSVFQRSTRTILLLLLLLAVACYYIATTYFGEGSGNTKLLPLQLEQQKEIAYIYKVHLISGGTLEGVEVRNDNGNILIKNKKGLEVILELSSVRYIEKIEKDNRLSRSVIYGTKPR